LQSFQVAGCNPSFFYRQSRLSKFMTFANESDSLQSLLSDLARSVKYLDFQRAYLRPSPFFRQSP
jgi:hypothetical protein